MKKTLLSLALLAVLPLCCLHQRLIGKMRFVHQGSGNYLKHYHALRFCPPVWSGETNRVRKVPRFIGNGHLTIYTY